MKNKIRIIVDSAADFSSLSDSRVTILPMTVRFGDEEFRDGVTIDHKLFYSKLIESDELPATSQITPAEFADAIAKAHKAGEDVIVITLSSKLSGTYQSACIAAGEAQGNVYVVDSLSVAIGEGILTHHALMLADMGMNAQGIAQRLDEDKHNIRLIALLDTLEYLKKGGRISKTVAFAGEMLSIKPVVHVLDGEVQMLGKARGSKKANNLLAAEIENAGGVDFEKPLLLGYSGLEDSLLRKYIEDSAHMWEGFTEKLYVAPIGSIIGTHVGPGAVAVAFFSKNNNN